MRAKYFRVPASDRLLHRFGDHDSMAQWSPRSTLFPYTTLFRSQMGPLLGHTSTAEYQRAEFIDQSILPVRIVVGKILLEVQKTTRLNSSPTVTPCAVFSLIKTASTGARRLSLAACAT